MHNLLSGLTIVEGASFIAGPSCALHLQQMGARVIRFDMIGGGPDFRRWPLAPGGGSLYWEGLNKGKLSIAIDLSKAEGRELAAALVTAPGKTAAFSSRTTRRTVSSRTKNLPGGGRTSSRCA